MPDTFCQERYGLCALLGDVKDQHIHVRSDNTTAIAYVNKMGGIKSVLCDKVAQEIWKWAQNQNCWITASHIPGSQNSVADSLSRKFDYEKEWKLKKSVFEEIIAVWPKPTIDWFASRTNKQLEKYVSWKPDPYALHVDAFTMCWSSYYTYLFPPFSQISCCLQKVIQDQAEVLMLAPIWPTQAWFPQLMKLLIDYPRILPQHKSLLSLENSQRVHPLHKTLTFMACRLSGNRSFSKKNSERTTDILLQSWRDSTKKQYSSCIKKWVCYCNERKIDTIYISVMAGLDFLTHLFDSGLGYSTINTARSALSSFVILDTGISFGSHPIVIRFLKAVFNLRPTQPRYKEIWDVENVLVYLRKLSPVKTLSLKDLTFKLVMLLALTCVTGVQTLHLLSLDSMDKNRSSFSFRIEENLKQSRPGYTNPMLNVKSYPVDRRLCPLLVLNEYLFRTKHRRKSQYLLVSYIKPHDRITTSTISRWIRIVLQRSGIDITKFKAHSVRAAATSKAFNKQIPVQDIMKSAGWTLESTFSRFYNKKIVKQKDVAKAILQ